MTPLQHRCLEYVRLFIDSHGYSPSYGDISKEFGCSRSQAFETVSAIVDQGELVRTAAKKRNLRLPDAKPTAAAIEALAAVQGTWWTIQHQAVAKAAVDAVLHIDLGPSDDEDMLQLYDIIPDVWCGPDRGDATKAIAENIAFAVLDAWMKAVRAELTPTPKGEQHG